MQPLRFPCSEHEDLLICLRCVSLFRMEIVTNQLKLKMYLRRDRRPEGKGGNLKASKQGRCCGW